MHQSQFFSSLSYVDFLTNIRLIATDMDGTLTCKGKFTQALLQAFQELATAGIQVVIVTGRSAGWVSGIATYLPVAGAIAENGGLFYLAGNDNPIALTSITNLSTHRHQLATVFAELQAQFPQIKESNDNRFRITDWTFDVADLSACDLNKMDELCQTMGWGFTYSHVQCHIKPLKQDKAVGLLRVLQEYFPEVNQQQVVTVGDSPNDESLFNADYFPLSVGVANVLEYIERLGYKPAYVTTSAEGEGFCELVKRLLGGLTTGSRVMH
jgi:HAD superfamily hydrolase (TIGR01484 family)